jgi:hypothetical protein
MDGTENDSFIRHHQHGQPNTSNNCGTPNTTQHSGRYYSDAQTLLKVSASRKWRYVQTKDDKRKTFPIANGSVTSMLDWSIVAKLDLKQ